MSTDELKYICELATIEIADRVAHNLERWEVDELREYYNDRSETDFDEDIKRFLPIDEA